MSVRERRVALGMSQQQLADKAGVSRGTIRNIEDGSVQPILATEQAISAVLGTDSPLQSLYTAIEAVLLDHAPLQPAYAPDPNLAELACCYQRLTGWTVEQEERDGD